MARRKSRLKRLGVLVGVGLAAATVAQELRKPQNERTWHGDLYGIPYDYRPPTVEKLKATYWAPDDSRVLMPKVWGFGWDVNVGRVVRMASEAMSDAMSDARTHGDTAVDLANGTTRRTGAVSGRSTTPR